MSDYTLNLTGRIASAIELPIEIQLAPVRTHEYAALVRLCGDHDLSTSGDLRNSLGSLEGDVLVDLTECTFIDSTAIGVLVLESQARVRRGQRLELLVPEGNAVIARAIEVSGVRGALGVRRS
jgi:anti-anti-sigma factor